MLSLPPLPTEDLQQILSQTAEQWEEAREKSFFITGGTGFFGMWLLESFSYINEILNLNAKAVILTRNPEVFARKAPHLYYRSDLHFIEGDIRSFPHPIGQFDYIIHAATEVASGAQTEPTEMLSTIIEGTQYVLDFAKTAGAKKMLLTSSGAIYGSQPSELTHIPEDHVTPPGSQFKTSAYSTGKREAERLAISHSLQHEYEIKIARCFAFVGPHLPLNSVFAIGNFIRNAIDQQPIKIHGDGTPMRSYLYASDLTTWLWSLLFSAPSNRAYNVGSDDALSISQLANLVKKTLDNPAEIEIQHESPPSRPISRYVPSVLRAQQELDLKVTVSLPEAIAKTARWIRKASIE